MNHIWAIRFVVNDQESMVYAEIIGVFHAFLLRKKQKKPISINGYSALCANKKPLNSFKGFKEVCMGVF